MNFTGSRSLSPTVDVTYSPDDGGWYLSRYPDGATSQVFSMEGDAIRAHDRHEVRWEDDETPAYTSCGHEDFPCCGCDR